VVSNELSPSDNRTRHETNLDLSGNGLTALSERNLGRLELEIEADWKTEIDAKEKRRRFIIY